MQILVLYYSNTGRTKKLAESVAEGVNRVSGVECLLKTTAEVVKEDFINSEGVIAGSPVYFGTMAGELKLVMDKFVGTRRQMIGKVGAAFATGNHHSGGKETTLMSIIQAFLIYGMIIVGDPLESGGHYGVAGSGELDDRCWQEGVLFGERVANVVKKLRSKS
ncbi:NAD(P)H-dependent oxidoreductase [bacterium]|nr:NAD(P)H-dependent oxidoreductase [bacterium]